MSTKITQTETVTTCEVNTLENKGICIDLSVYEIKKLSIENNLLVIKISKKYK